MKRRQRRPVLDINNEQSESTRGRWQNKYQQIAVDHPEQNGSQNNPLASLLGQYNSDSETEDGKQESNKLNDKVNDFLKEIQMIAPDTAESKDVIKTGETQISSIQQNETLSCSWQECFDETTGYPYYWHIETNEVTWEMPSEMKILRDKTPQNNQSQIQTHHSHSQVQQWANFLPNTYPELQTNIPEGMIPKEVVARNRNRQVGLTKGRQAPEISSQTPKKSGPRDDDSDDEKIEMITSFGNDESESEASENDSPSEKKPPVTQRAQKSAAIISSEKNAALEEGESVSIGPLLPPGIIPMIHGPENLESLEMRSELESRKKKPRQNKSQEEDSAPEIKEIKKTEDIDEEDILKRLKNQAKLLQSLGGEVPESVETLIKNDVEEEEEEEEEDDIISQIEKEMPVDHAVERIITTEDIIAEEKSEGREFPVEKTKEIERQLKIVEENDGRKKTDTIRSKEFKISLVAGYSDDSDIEEEISPKKINPQPLFPISEFVQKENSATDSNQARDLQSAIDPGVGKLDIKQIDATLEQENAKNVDEETLGIDSQCQEDKNGTDSLETEENKVPKTETEPPRVHPFFENLEVPNKAFQRKKRIAFDVVPNKTIRPQPEAVSINSSKPEAQTLSFSGLSSHEDVERHGFGFHKDQQQEIEGTEVSSEVGERQRGGSDRDVRETQSKKAINFVKGETTGLENQEEEKIKKPDSEKDKDSMINSGANKQLKELTDVVMEKIKFLSEGSQNLSAIQIMVIQLQTLVAAWEAGDLRESYLYEWLKGTGHELGRLEQAAAPPGWDCHWDRSHKRYYYRNSLNGDAQWTYPEADVVGGTEEMDLCTTPPPPDDEEPQIIEGNEGRIEPTEKLKEKSSSITITGDNKIVQITKDEYKSLEAPPPPQISSPSPPPPPRIFAEDLKRGKKRRGSISERILDTKKEKSESKESVDPPLPPSPPKNTSQPPLPPNPPIIPNPPNSEPLPPGVDPKDMLYPLSAVATLEPGTVYVGATQQSNPIYAATIADRTGIALPLIDHRSAIIQGQLMHYPTYQHLHNQAMIAAAGSLGGQEAVQFMLTDYTQVYANTQVIAKPPVKKSQNNQSLGSALDSFYSDIASIEKTNAEQESASQEFDTTLNTQDANTPPPIISNLPPTTVVAASNTLPNETEEKADPAAGKEKKKKKAKVGIGKKQKEMSTMVAKWQKAQQDFDDSE